MVYFDVSLLYSKNEKEHLSHLKIGGLFVVDYWKIGGDAYKIDLPTYMNISSTFNITDIFEYSSEWVFFAATKLEDEFSSSGRDWYSTRSLLVSILRSSLVFILSSILSSSLVSYC